MKKKKSGSLDLFWLTYKHRPGSCLLYTSVSRSLTEDQMTDEYIKRYWNPALEKVQPVEAYVINARAIIKAMMKALE